MKKLFWCGMILFASSMQAQVTGGLVAKYSFNAGDATDEVGSNDGTVVNAVPVADRFGNANSAFSFNGSNSYINFGDAPEFRFDTAPFSISMWLKYSVNQESSVLQKRAGMSGGYTQYNFCIYNSITGGGFSTKLWCYLRPDAGPNHELGGNPLDNNWHHVVVVRSSDTSKMYLDGALISVNGDTLTGNLNVTGYPLVAGYNYDGGGGFYNGLLDDIRIYNRELSNLEVDSLFNESNPVTGLDHPLVTKQVKVYPNPARGTLRFSESVSVRMFSISGTLVLECTDATNADISSLSSGIYTASITTRDGRQQLTRFFVE